MMTDVYAAGLTDGDYVVVDKDTICQRTAAPMCRTHATSHRYTAQPGCFVCCAGRPMASVPPASAAAPKRCAALSCSFYGSPDSAFCSKHDPSVIAKSRAVRWGGAQYPRIARTSGDSQAEMLASICRALPTVGPTKEIAELASDGAAELVSADLLRKVGGDARLAAQTLLRSAKVKPGPHV
jgi:hypothetical protein